MQNTLLIPHRQQVEEVLPMPVVLSESHLVPRLGDISHINLVQQVDPTKHRGPFVVFIIQVPFFQYRLRLQILVLPLRNACGI